MASSDTRRSAIAWALYDCGNSAFATTVMAGFFPLFFKQYWSAGASVSASTQKLGIANSLASIVVALLAPVLGAIADAGQGKKRWLAAFAAIGCTATAALALVGKGQYGYATLCYALATVGFAGSLVFYDALLVSVADDASSDRVSSFGYALGYLGGGILFGVNVAMTLKPKLFGLSDAAEGVKVSFFTVALWWALFTLPLMLRVREKNFGSKPANGAWHRGLTQLSATFKRVRGMPLVWRFLLAYWLYIDAVDTVIRMAV
ncbi:MAG: putative MFS-type transporter YxiO, partial [Pseudomonadota bacterium]